MAGNLVPATRISAGLLRACGCLQTHAVCVMPPPPPSGFDRHCMPDPGDATVADL